MRTTPAFFLCASALLYGCTTMPETLALGSASERAPETTFPLKIGLLSDSQITSQNGHSDFHYRSKTADALVDVSIRPPALERVLATEMLEVALTRLTEDDAGDHRGVDVILYLGDAANSGGADEIETVLGILDEHRSRTDTPIYILIGNHDYLGAGNIVSPGLRFAMLNREGRPQNRAMTKYDVLTRFSDFNHANDRLPAGARFEYVDNIATVRRSSALDHERGLYLSGVLTYRYDGAERVQMLLLDSSDYKDAPDWSEVADLGFYGAIGSVSFKDEPGFVSQTSYLNQFTSTSNPAYRILASHYPKDHLDRMTFAKPGEVPFDLTDFVWDVTDTAVSVPTFSETLNQNLAPLLTDGKHNYWVSGHTHVSTLPRPERYGVAGLLGEKHFKAINVGSTTDYRAHVAIVERFDRHRNDRLDGAVGYRELPLTACDTALLTSLPAAIGAYGREHADAPMFQSLIEPKDEWIAKARQGSWLNEVGQFLDPRKSAGMTWDDRYWIDVGAMVLGLDKTYRAPAWTDAQSDAAEAHLRQFIDRLVERTGGDRNDVVASLGLVAGAYESGRLAVTFDFSPKAMMSVCADPR